MIFGNLEVVPRNDEIFGFITSFLGNTGDGDSSKKQKKDFS